MQAKKPANIFSSGFQPQLEAELILVLLHHENE